MTDSTLRELGKTLLIRVLTQFFPNSPDIEISDERINVQDCLTRIRTLDDDAGYRAKVALRMEKGYTKHQLKPLPCKTIEFVEGFNPEAVKAEVAAVVPFKKERHG